LDSWVLLYYGGSIVSWGFSCIRGGLGFIVLWGFYYISGVLLYLGCLLGVSIVIWVFDGVCWGLLLYFGSLVGFGSCGFVVPCEFSWIFYVG
jgi:hypothetical protein